MMSLPMIYEGAVGRNDISVVFLIIYIFNYTTGQIDLKHVKKLFIWKCLKDKFSYLLILFDSSYFETNKLS